VCDEVIWVGCGVGRINAGAGKQRKARNCRYEKLGYEKRVRVQPVSDYRREVPEA
jgi:hypothetical protein